MHLQAHDAYLSEHMDLHFHQHIQVYREILSLRQEYHLSICRKLQKTMEARPASERTQEMVDQYNAEVKAVNEAVNEFNTINNEMNNARAKAVNGWNQASSAFMDRHVPQ